MTTGEGLRATKPTILSGLFISMLTILLSLLTLEGIIRLAWKDPYQWDRRLMFFSEGSNLRNTAWGIGYQPNEQIHAQTHYITRLKPLETTKEYDYRFTSNSQGLVQQNNLSGTKPSILFLGDSFTEGQGARPWFYELEADWPRMAQYQLVNGGMFGTGVEAWGRLLEELSSRLMITKTVIIFISDDWNRPVWQFPDQTLRCLNVAALCEGPEEFYGVPEKPAEAREHIGRIARYRVDYLSHNRNPLERSAVYRRLVTPAVRRFEGFFETGSLQGEASKQLDVSKRIAASIVTKLGRDNVVFIYLPQRYELGSGPNWYGRKAKEFILQQGFWFVDGRARCGLVPRDYYEHDGHPNPSGYRKITACVRRAAEEAFAPLRGSHP